LFSPFTVNKMNI